MDAPNSTEESSMQDEKRFFPTTLATVDIVARLVARLSESAIKQDGPVVAKITNNRATSTVEVLSLQRLDDATGAVESMLEEGSSSPHWHADLTDYYVKARNPELNDEEWFPLRNIIDLEFINTPKSTNRYKVVRTEDGEPRTVRNVDAE
jgi:hypothetical protein